MCNIIKNVISDIFSRYIIVQLLLNNYDVLNIIVGYRVNESAYLELESFATRINKYRKTLL